jgi:CDP-diacylglycerol--serine O-phosphatidyltransferase
VPFFVLLLIVLAIAALFIAQAKGLLAIATVYALSGPGYWLWTKVRRKTAA